jgi:hypothetical protein
MNFNHLLTDKELKRLANKNSKCECNWLPASEGSSQRSNNIAVQMYCKNLQQ